MLEDALLVVSELVTNSVCHSGASDGAIVVRVELTGTMVRLEVEDPGRGGVIAPRSPDLDGGFGLNLVQGLSERWGLERVAAGGTRVWAQLAWASAPASGGGGGEGEGGVGGGGGGERRRLGGALRTSVAPAVPARRADPRLSDVLECCHVGPLLGEQERLNRDVLADVVSDRNTLTLRPVACSTTLMKLSAICC